MKKLLALLLVLCMVLGMVACAKPADSADSTTTTGEETTETEETVGNREDISVVDEDDLILKTDDVDSNDAYINPEKFGGKTIHIAGINSETFDDIENMGKGSYLWMMRAACEDWAALNNCTIEYVCDNDSTSILTAVNSGETPDLVLYTNAYPLLSNLDITRAFTDEELAVVSKIVGEGWASMIHYQGEIHGLEVPWGGNHWYYYNRTMYENYGAKSPKEYYQEGNWTFETMEKCHESVTRDNNGDGKINEDDTYGISSTYLTDFMGAPYHFYMDPVTGKLTCTYGTSEEYRRLLEMSYTGRTETLSVLSGYYTCKTSANPRPSAMFADAEWYNFEHLYDVLDNGDVIECLPNPVFTTEQPTRVTNHTVRYMAMLNSCDENEAAFALYCYMLKVGMRYISDFSVGLYECTYDGIQGASDYSKGWLKQFKKVLQDRRRAFAEIEDWDQEHYLQMVKDLFASETRQYIVSNYDSAGSSGETIKTEGLPPASVIAKLAEAGNAFVTKYNSLYAK